MKYPSGIIPNTIYGDWLATPDCKYSPPARNGKSAVHIRCICQRCGDEDYRMPATLKTNPMCRRCYDRKKAGKKRWAEPTR